ncbi:TolC family protein [Williamwhitmania taraxaci]|uniref:Outer membrane factor, OMF family n=1 Tax=Williamwhitmania taraxaci TaxID=1640674 RepID=A0A1G6KZ46_9BACT|nr:TolC family protein [Williamwhitmania taraxaci]SDC35636.1 outer membrane factor, OMF family [Williamwhitmania taraxaci]
MLVNVYKQKLAILILIGVAVAKPALAQVWTLQQCIDTALVNNKNLQIGRNGILMGEQKHKEATANLIPKITANADYRYYTDQPYQLMPASVFGGPTGTFKEAQFGVPHNINANIQLALPLYNSQVYGAIQITNVALELNELQYKKTEEQLFYEISNLYYNVQIMHRQLSFIDSNMINSNKLLQNMQLLKEQLLVKMTDVEKVRLQNEQLLTQKELIKSKFDQTMNALKFTMGVSIDRVVSVDSVISFQNGIDYISGNAIETSIAQTQSRVLITELKTLKRSRLPSLSLYGTYGTAGFGYNESPNDFLKFFPVGFVGVQMSVPLFNGTVTKRKINQKKVEQQNSELQINIVTEQNAMLTANAKRQRIIAQKTIVNMLSQIQLAQAIYEQTVLQQKQGLAILTDVLLADNAVREAQQAYLSAVVDYLKADLDLRKLTGNISTIKN